MGPLAWRLPARGAAGKAIGEVAGGQPAADAPARGDCSERAEHEAAVAERGVRDAEAARAPFAAAPQSDVEVEHARAPAPPAPPAESALDRFETRQHLGWLEIAF